MRPHLAGGRARRDPHGRGRRRRRVRRRREPPQRVRAAEHARASRRAGGARLDHVRAGRRHEGRGGGAGVDAARVVVADDHAPTRAGVRLALEGRGFTVCGEATDALSAIDAAIRERPDVCLLDIHMPGGGIRAAAEITARLPDTAVVMLTVSRNDDDLFNALRAGASGYLLKDTDPERLPHALRGVLAGEAALPRSLVAHLIDEFRARERRRSVPLVGRRSVTLTSREWEVLEMLRENLPTGEMAKRLGISDVTVRRHVGGILKKLRVRTRKEAVSLLRDDARDR
ncbi:MAG: response regulator transcription factor [Thermoleophilia bacterium]|nr:response regulator transcription factor [Thermoleophilia bacterium]